MVRSFLIALAAALLLARLGPFGTFAELPPGELYAYWIGLTLLVWLQIEIALHLLRGFRPTGLWPWPARAIVAALLAAVPGAFEVAWAESLLRVERDLGLLDLLFIYGDVALIAAAIALLVEWARPRAAGVAAAVSQPEEETPPALLDEVPPDRRGMLLALAAEDHYLRIYTDRGEALVLRRFSDALVEVADMEGARVHRSWWVAKQAVTGSERSGDRIVLLLTNGVRAPVSRTYLLRAREAGLIPTPASSA